MGSAHTQMTPAEQRIELQIEGLRSVMSGGLLTLAQFSQREEKLLERIADALEKQNKLLAKLVKP